MAIVHEAMSGSARAMAKVSGMDEYAFVTVDYPHVPLAVWTAEEIQEIAQATAPKVLAHLSG